MQKPHPLISIITPALNEAPMLPHYYQRMSAVLNSLSDRYQFEWIFTDNASTDETYAIIQKFAETDSRINVIRFARNVGYQHSIYTGYCFAKGDCAIEFDCDLQDPPELLPQFLEQWEAGNHIVYGIRQTRQEGPVIQFLRRSFYRLLNFCSDDKLPHDAGDFMLIDRRVLNEIKRYQLADLYLRGLIFSLGFQQKGIAYDRHHRQAGKSKFNLFQMVALAVKGFFAYTVIPIRMMSYLGILIFIVAIGLSIYYTLGKLVFDMYMPSGFTTTTLLLLFSIAINAIFLGIIGEYLIKIYRQLQQRYHVPIEKQLK